MKTYTFIMHDKIDKKQFTYTGPWFTPAQFKELERDQVIILKYY